MIAVGIWATSIERKPKQTWCPGIQGPSGTLWTQDYPNGLGGLILPDDMPEAERDLALWAYEIAFFHGHHDGQRKLQREMKQLLDIR